MYIGEPFSWKPAAFEGQQRHCERDHERDDCARARRLHQRGAPLLYGGGRYQREEAQRDL